jgi:hypothetical protein
MDCVAAGGSQERATARPELWQFSRSSASWRGHMTGILSVGSRQMPPTSRIETADSLAASPPFLSKCSRNCYPLSVQRMVCEACCERSEQLNLGNV